jgi:hypothetical protein
MSSIAKVRSRFSSSIHEFADQKVCSRGITNSLGDIKGF